MTRTLDQASAAAVTSVLNGARAAAEELSAAAVYIEVQTGLSAADACEGGWWRERRSCLCGDTW